MDTIGSLGRTLHDAVLGLNAIAQPDKGDMATLNPSRVQVTDYTIFMSAKEALKGARFGLPWKRCWEYVEKDQMDVAQKVLKLMKEAGATITQTDFPSAEERIPSDGQWDWYLRECESMIYSDKLLGNMVSLLSQSSPSLKSMPTMGLDRIFLNALVHQ
jgi:amidase